MDRFRQKGKKEKSAKHKAKPQPTAVDIKTMKENIKIKEILRTVKINSSMRIKAPKGSKVMCNKDLGEPTETGCNGDLFIFESEVLGQTESSTDPEVETCNENNVTPRQSDTKVESTNDKNKNSCSLCCDQLESELDNEVIDSIKEIEDVIDNASELDTGDTKEVTITDEETLKYHKINHGGTGDMSSDTLSCLPNINSTDAPQRMRKLSLDHTLLSRRPSLSQSEVDLHAVGKSPLERKSSFFRKKMDSFFKNTSEIFKRQSWSKADSMGIQRRGSMSYSLQSLNDSSNYSSPRLYTSPAHSQEIPTGSSSSLASGSLVARGDSSLASQDSRHPSDQQSLDGSQNLLASSQPLDNLDINDIPIEAYIQEQMLNSRATSMSSGLDSASRSTGRSSNRSNRVTWLASEGLTNYLRRVIQDESSREMRATLAQQDPTASPAAGQPLKDARGRRLSYQRAVSGEDPVRYNDFSLRRRNYIPENCEVNYELASILAEFSRSGVPPLRDFDPGTVSHETLKLLSCTEQGQKMEDAPTWREFVDMQMAIEQSTEMEKQQASLRELVSTEVDHIHHLGTIVNILLAGVHALQDKKQLMDVDACQLFGNIADVLHCSRMFFDMAICPMVVEAKENNTPLNPSAMVTAFTSFPNLMSAYEKFVMTQSSAADYHRFLLQSHVDFRQFANWAQSLKECNRLQMPDLMAKPLQRLTKYPLLLRRVLEHTHTEPERSDVAAMETAANSYLMEVNRGIRQQEELKIMDRLTEIIDPYEIDFKDEDLDRAFRVFNNLNLTAPMLGCEPHHRRTLIHQGDIKFKDNIKEVEARIIILTDMILVCKKVNVKGQVRYRMIRPKFMVSNMRYEFTTKARDVLSLIVVMVDAVQTSYTAFQLSEPGKDSSMKLWENKIKEATVSYELAAWCHNNPARLLTISEWYHDSTELAPLYRKQGAAYTPEEVLIEKAAMERALAMVRKVDRRFSTDQEYSRATANSSFEGEAALVRGLPSFKTVQRGSTGGSSSSRRNSRLSSYHQSTRSSTSYEDTQAGPSRHMGIYRAGSSVEHQIPPLHPHDDVTSITVNVVDDSDMAPVAQRGKESFELASAVSRQSSRSSSRPSSRPVSRCASTTGQTLQVQPLGVASLLHSLPDLTVESTQPKRPLLQILSRPNPSQASERLYQSHQEHLNRNRLSATHSSHYLTPDHRGTSYPPPSPTRASLKRGLAFSYSMKNPPLSKMGHVASEAGTSKTKQEDRGAMSPQPVTRPANDLFRPHEPSSQAEIKKSSKLISSRNKGATSPARKEGD